MLQSKEAIQYFKEQEAYLQMPDDKYKVLVMYILDCYLEDENFQEADLYSYIGSLNTEENDVLKVLTDIISSHENNPSYTFDYFKSLVYEIKECMTIESKISFLKDKLEFIIDPKEKGKITNEIIKLNQELKKKKYKNI